MILIRPLKRNAYYIAEMVYDRGLLLVHWKYLVKQYETVFYIFLYLLKIIFCGHGTSYVLQNIAVPSIIQNLELLFIE